MPTLTIGSQGPTKPSEVSNCAQGPLFTARRGFLPGEDADWVKEIRREIDSLYLRALESYANACLRIGGTEIAAAERAGRELVAP